MDGLGGAAASQDQGTGGGDRTRIGPFWTSLAFYPLVLSLPRWRVFRPELHKGVSSLGTIAP